MASNRIDIDVKVDDKGTTKKVGLQSKKAGKSIDDLGRSAQTADRNLKGAAQASANGTKNFSKMAQGIGGSLVPAYATLAANIFAVTAAFGAFQRAAQVQQLENNLVRLGNVGGQNLRGLADDLKNITDNAIDTEAALRSVAQGTTQGFSGSQLKGLTTIAKGASIALGRDMTDAMDRLVRGTAKLEPEILDELGIIVRLDDAAKDYAAGLGKTAAQLTAFEKQQAFANAVLEQGTKKFAGIAAAAEANPFDQLAASFGDLKKSFFEGIGLVLNPLVKLLSISDAALIGVVGLLAGTIVSQLTPALGEMAKKSKENFLRLEKRAAAASVKIQSDFQRMASKLSTFDIAPKGFKDLQNQMKAGTKDATVYSTALKKIGSSIGGQTAALNKLKKAQKGQSGAQLKATKLAIEMKKKEIAQLRQMQSETRALRKLQEGGGLSLGGTRGQQRAAGNARVRAGIGRTEAAATKMMQDAGIVDQFRIAGAATEKMSKKIGQAEGAIGKLGASFEVAKGSARLFGAALLNAIPIIGQVLFFGGMLYSFLDGFINFPWESSKMEEATKKIIHGLDSVRAASLELRIALAQTDSQAEKTFLTLKNRTGVVDQLASVFTDLVRASNSLKSDEIKQYADEIRDLGNLDTAGGKLKAEFTALRLDDQVINKLRAEGKEINAANKAREKQLILEQKIEALVTDQTVDKYQALAAAIASRAEAGVALGKESKVYKEIDKAVDELQAKIAKGEDVTVEYLAGISKAVQDTEAGTRRVLGAFDGLNQAVSNFNSELTKLVSKQDTPFTNLQSAAEVLLGTFTTIRQEAGSLTGVDLMEAIEKKGGKGALQFAEGLKSTDAYKTRRAQLDGAPSMLNDFGTMTEGNRDALALESAQGAFVAQLKLVDKEYRTQNNTLKNIKAEIKEISEFSKVNAIFAGETANLEKKAIDTQVTRNNNIAALLEKYKNIEGVEEYLNQLTAENIRLNKERELINQNNLMILQAEAADKKRLFDLENRILGVKKQSFNLDQAKQSLEDSSELRQLQRNPFFEILDQGRTAIDQEIKRTEDKLKFEKENQDIINAAKTAMIEAEYALIDAQLRAEMEKLRLRSTDMSTGVTQAQRDAAAASADRLQGLIGAESGGGTLGEAQAGAIANVAAESEVAVGKLQEKLMGLRESKRDLMDVNVMANTIATSLESNMTSALTSLIDGTKSAKQAFADMAKSIIADIAAMIAKQLVFNALKSMFGGFLPFAEGGVASGGFEAFAKGGYAQGGFRAFANGGTVNKPTLGLVGEGKYNEAIVPLPDGRSIPVQMQGGGSQQNNVTVNVAIDQNGRASSTTQSDGQQGNEIGNMVAAAVQKELQHQKRAGGILNPYGNA